VVKTGVLVKSMDDLPPAQVTLFDTSPSALVRITGDRMPPRVRRAYTRFRHGPAAFKVDLAVEGGVPWTAPACREAGTLHIGGTLEEIADAEAKTTRGRMPERPFVLVGQQYLCDPSRSNGDVHPLWAYAHVPAGYDGDATDALLAQIERFAPGFRDRIVGSHTTSPAEFQAYNPNYIAGDIGTGANDLRQLLQRPRLVNPYDTGIPGIYLCSAATPPGGGVHGMCGYHAARGALRHLGLPAPRLAAS
jgi:phytoene dehydrogenase-like protein